MSRRLLVIACVVGWASLSGAQQPVPGYTQMILGVGSTFQTRAYNLGFEHKPANSPIAWRVMLEHWNRSTDLGEPPSYSRQRLFGAQLLGLRLFRPRSRLQPYILGGLGIYHEESWSGSMAMQWTGEGFVTTGPWQYSHRNRVLPSIIWGTGLNLRLRSVTFFGEFKLPVPSQGYGLSGPAAPLTFGIRF